MKRQTTAMGVKINTKNSCPFCGVKVKVINIFLPVLKSTVFEDLLLQFKGLWPLCTSSSILWVFIEEAIHFRAVGTGGGLRVLCSPPPDFSRSVKPISTMGQIIPTILLLTPPLRIFNPSYGPEFICTSRKMHFVFTRYNSLKLILNENSYFCLCSIKFLVNVS